MSYCEPPSRRLCELGQGGSILDVGCGNGRNTYALLAAGWEVVALDIRIECLKALRTLQGLLHLLNADANMLPLRSCSLDAVLDSFTYTFLDKERYAKEVARVLREGGVALVEFDDDPHVKSCPELLMLAEPLVTRLSLEKVWVLSHEWGNVAIEKAQVPFLALLLVKRSAC